MPVDFLRSKKKSTLILEIHMWPFSSPVYFSFKFKHQLEHSKLCCLKHTHPQCSTTHALPEPQRPAARQLWCKSPRSRCVGFTGTPCSASVSLHIKLESEKHQPRICQCSVHITLINLQPLPSTIISESKLVENHAYVCVYM